MLKTNNFVSSVGEVPREWVFEFYLQLDVELCGQDIQIKSVFNPKENTPSMFIYFDKRKAGYRYKDFSSDNQGDGVDMIQKMFGIESRPETAHKIVLDYNNYVMSNPVDYMQRVISSYEKYKVVGHQLRNWNTDDKTYWTQFKIGSEDLSKYNIKPLRLYNLAKHENKELKTISITGSNLYGYFKQDGTLYKVYQPKNRKNKFIRIYPYIQGSEQLTFKVPYLVIASSLKDLMCFNKLRFNNVECIAPESESVLIDEQTIAFYKTKYEGILTIMDNDEAGIKSMLRYTETYKIPGVQLKLEKDIAKSVQEHGPDNVRVVITPQLKKAFENYKQNHL